MGGARDGNEAELNLEEEELEELNYLSYRYAEYSKIPANERNIIGHRPEQRVSGKLSQGSVRNMYSLFIPAQDDNINRRNIPDFENSGYGF